MRMLILCLFLVSCGGGTVPSKPEPFKPINLSGTWKLSITIPECDRKFESTYYVAINDASFDLLSTMTSLGEYPDPNNIAACNSKIIPDIIDLSPYTTSSTAIQFREFLSLRFMWDYSGIDIMEYSDNQISLFRTVQTRVGERVWLYEFNHTTNPYSSMQRHRTAGINDGLVAVKGCQGTYNTTFRYRDTFDASLTFLKNSRYLELLQIANDNPTLTIGDQCGTTRQGSNTFLPTYYPPVITALEFRNMMQGIWGKPTTILSWHPDKVQIVRVVNDYIVGYTFN